MQEMCVCLRCGILNRTIGISSFAYYVQCYDSLYCSLRAFFAYLNIEMPLLKSLILPMEA